MVMDNPTPVDISVSPEPVVSITPPVDESVDGTPVYTQFAFAGQAGVVNKDAIVPLVTNFIAAIKAVDGSIVFAATLDGEDITTVGTK